MELKDIVAVSGQGGLHKIIGKTKNGLILETIGIGKKFATGIHDRVSILEDISMYSVEGDIKLSEILFKAHETGNVPQAKEDPKTQRKFLVDLINLDNERVYDSDIKKFFNWYYILLGVFDFTKLKDAEKSVEKENTTQEEENVKPAEEKTKATNNKNNSSPKTAVPKNIGTKTNSKGAGNSKTTYRPKSV